jgi:hypothetical protein
MVIESASSNSASSSALTEMISIGGLPLSDLRDTGVSVAVPLVAMVVPCSSTLILTASVEDVAGGGAAPAGEGDAGDEGITSSGCCDGVRTFMVTRLERGSEGGSVLRSWGSGVVGMGPVGGFESIFMAESLGRSGGDVSVAGELGEELIVSTDRLRGPLAKDVRRRFREVRSLSSSKGLGRVEQGSEETARSLDGSAVEA